MLRTDLDILLTAERLSRVIVPERVRTLAEETGVQMLDFVPLQDS